MQKVVKVRDTKFGIAMVLEAGTMVLGFKVDPYDALKKIVKEIQSLHQVYSSCPIFGVEYSVADEEGEGPAPPTTDVIQEEVELVDTKRDTLAVSLNFVFPDHQWRHPQFRQDRIPMSNAPTYTKINTYMYMYELSWTFYAVKEDSLHFT